MPNLTRMAGRLLIGSTFAFFGTDAVRNPGQRTKLAAPLLDKVRTVVPLPADDDLLVKANGAGMAVGGALLALGILPRAAATGLAALMVPTTLAGHAFWQIEDPTVRAMQRTQFLKNLTLVGGLLVTAAD